MKIKKTSITRPDLVLAQTGKTGKDALAYKNGRTHLRGYILILLPEHPHSYSNGYVREHRLVVEKHIGRYLVKGECIHHINEIKHDNRPENLYLFKTTGDHTSFHHNPCKLESNIL